MTLLAVERMKLFSTRSPFWCAALALVITIGLAALITVTAGDKVPLTVATTQFGYRFGLSVVMVLAVLSVTTEYRFGTIRATFQAVPRRPAVILAKATVVGLLCAVLGLAAGFGSWGVARLLEPSAPLALQTLQEWRNVAGMGAIYLIAGVLALSVGLLLRQTAGAVAVVLIYVQLVENLVRLIPNVGDDLARWAPFNVGANFLAAGSTQAYQWLNIPTDITLNSYLSLGYFAGIAAVLLLIAIVVTNRRDA